VREAAASVLRGVVTEERRTRVYKRTTVLLKNADPSVRAAAASAMAGSASEQEKAAIDAASGAVGRFRRERFLMPRGAALSDYAGSDADGEFEHDSSAADSSAGTAVEADVRTGARKVMAATKTLAAFANAGASPGVEADAKAGGLRAAAKKVMGANKLAAMTKPKKDAARANGETASVPGSRGTDAASATASFSTGEAGGPGKGGLMGKKFKAAARMVGKLAAASKDAGMEWQAPQEEAEEYDPNKSSSEGEFSQSDTEPDIELPEVEEVVGEVTDGSVLGSQAASR